MSYKLEINNEISSVIITLNDDFKAGQEMRPVIEDLTRTFGEVTQPFYYVTDALKAKWSFSDMVLAMASTAGRGSNILKNEHLVEIIVVTTDGLIKLGVDALGQEQYGLLKARTFPTMDEAMAYLKKKGD